MWDMCGGGHGGFFFLGSTDKRNKTGTKQAKRTKREQKGFSGTEQEQCGKKNKTGTKREQTTLKK